ncbi:MAG: sigma-E processing peptidase SpoIIGA [Clostridiales bacterium]|nr:sigma-E processing peptidase SpoIIGA [Clostridiales bacterium]
MYYEFYIDQFFVEQLISECLLLLLTALLCNAVPCWRRILSGALLGAVCMTVFVWLRQPWLYLFSLPAAAAAAFWKRDLPMEWRNNLKVTFCLLAMTICFGGTLEALVILFPLSLRAALVPAFLLVRLIVCRCGRKSRKVENKAAVTIRHGGQSLTIEGFLDTGNQLAEPVTGRPVSIANEKALESLLDEAWEERQGFCLIPYHSLGTQEGWMRGVTFDEMSVTMQRGCRVFRRPVIALYEGRVSAREDFQMILHPEHAP